MADYAWVTLRIWPWQDAWLGEDEELFSAFDAADLIDGSKPWPSRLCGAMNGDFDRDIDDTGPGPTFEIVTISGEMRGGSWELREELNVLNVLRSRNIAFHLIGDAKYDWDGDETFWHPGMKQPFYASHANEGRYLSSYAYSQMAELCLPVEERVAMIDTFIEASYETIRTLSEQGREDMVGLYQSAIGLHNRRRAKLMSDDPEPAVMGDLVAAFFNENPDWCPTTRWKPKLRKTPVET